MKKLIGKKLAANILLIVLFLLIIFHILIISEILPYDIIWGGQVDGSKESLIHLEIIAIVILILFMIIITSKIGYITILKSTMIKTIGMWIIFAYFVLNTLGNLASDVTIENYIFAPITIVLAILSLSLAIENRE
jgi:hypothetical protein